MAPRDRAGQASRTIAGGWRCGFRCFEICADFFAHVGHGTGYFNVVEAGVAAFGWHGTNAIHSVFPQGVKAFAQAG